MIIYESSYLFLSIYVFDLKVRHLFSKIHRPQRATPCCRKCSDLSVAGGLAEAAESKPQNLKLRFDASDSDFELWLLMYNILLYRSIYG